MLSNFDLQCEWIADEPHAETLLITNTRPGRDLYQREKILVVELVNSKGCAGLDGRQERVQADSVLRMIYFLAKQSV